MKVQFKYARMIDGKLFAQGTHDIENKLLDHWFFKGLVREKHVLLLEEPPSSIEKEEKPVKRKREKASL